MNKPHNNMKNRQRGRNGGKPRPGGGGGGGGGGGRNPNFDGGNNNGRMRGNAQQLMEKFLAMARDASSAGDRVLAENYFQHADHYYRVLNARFEQQNGQPNQNGQQNVPRYQGDTQGDNQGDNQGNQGNQGGGQNFDRNSQDNQGGYNQNRNNNGNQGNPGCQGNQSPDQGHQQDAQPAPQQHAPPPPPPAAPPAVEQEIGLPPGILGIAPALPEPAAETAGEDGDADRGRQPLKPRRRGPHPASDAGE